MTTLKVTDVQLVSSGTNFTTLPVTSVLLHELRYLTSACARRSPCPPLYVFWFNQNSTSICVSKPEYVLVTVRISRIQLSVSYAPKLPEPGRGRWKVREREEEGEGEGVGRGSDRVRKRGKEVEKVWRGGEERTREGERGRRGEDKGGGEREERGGEVHTQGREARKGRDRQSLIYCV